MEKITLNFSDKEKEILDECTLLTKIKPTPLLRALIVKSLDELFSEIEVKKQIVVAIPGELESEKPYTFHITIDDETQHKYDDIHKYLPVWKSEFTKMRVMQKLRNIQNRKQSIEEMVR